MLSFAVGGLLGDVFLHLLPEASGQLMKSSTSGGGGGGGLQTVVDTQQYLGVRILAGIILFVIMESVFVQLSEADDCEEEKEKEKDEKEKFEEEEEEREITLNLPAGAVVANGVLRYRGSPVKMEKMQQQLHQLHQQQQNSKGLEIFIEFGLLFKNLLLFNSSEQGTVLFFLFIFLFSAHRRHRVPEPAGKRTGQLYARHVGGRLLSGLLQDGRPHHAGHYHPRDSPRDCR